jgi:hypothetical protein
VNEHLLVASEMLDRDVFVEEIGMVCADHIGTHRADHPIDHMAVPAGTWWSVSLRASTVGIVVATDDVKMRIFALPTRVVPR